MPPAADGDRGRVRVASGASGSQCRLGSEPCESIFVGLLLDTTDSQARLAWGKESGQCEGASGRVCVCVGREPNTAQVLTNYDSGACRVPGQPEGPGLSTASTVRPNTPLGF